MTHPENVNMMEDIKPSFRKAMTISLLIPLLSLPMALIPLIGQLLALTLIPYLSTAMGTRFTQPKERVPIALTVAIVWSGIHTAILLLAVNLIETPMGAKMEATEYLIIMGIWAMNLIFCVMGALHPWKDPFSETF